MPLGGIESRAPYYADRPYAEVHLFPAFPAPEYLLTISPPTPLMSPPAACSGDQQAV